MTEIKQCSPEVTATKFPDGATRAEEFGEFIRFWNKGQFMYDRFLGFGSECKILCCSDTTSEEEAARVVDSAGPENSSLCGTYPKAHYDNIEKEMFSGMTALESFKTYLAHYGLLEGRWVILKTRS
jgi:hypothetical protein